VDTLPSSPLQDAAPEPGVAWYRFAFLLTGDESAASAILEKIIEDAPDELAQLRGHERQNRWLLRQIRTQAHQWRSGHSPVDAGSLPGRVSALPEPARSVFALFHCADASLEELSECLALPQAAFAKALAKARQELGGTDLPEDALLSLHRPWRDAGEETADCPWHAEIEAIAMPSELALLFQAEPSAPGLRAFLFKPASFAIALAMIVVIGTLIYLVQTNAENFAGREALEALIQTGAKRTNPTAIPPTEAGKLDDWFVLNGFEGYAVPPPLDKAQAVGSRVWTHEGVAVAEVALADGARLLVFRAADFKERVEPGDWRVFQRKPYAVAVWSDRDTVCALFFKGKKKEIAQFLHPKP